MRRLFGKSGKTEIRDADEEKGASESDHEESQPKPEPKTRKKSHTTERRKKGQADIDDDDGAAGDASKSSRARQRKNAPADEFEETPSEVPKRSRHKPSRRLLVDEDDDDPDDEVPEPKPKPKPKPRQRSTIAESMGSSPARTVVSDSEREAEDVSREFHDPDPPSRSPSPSSKRRHRKPKETATRKSKQKHQHHHPQQPSHLRGSDFANDSAEEIAQFIRKEELPQLPKIESGKGIHFMSSTYSYRKPISTFRVRARLLKYPTITDLGVWPGDMAVIDDRVFQWQEKVFSKAEVKRLQKLDNCITEQEKKYHDEIRNNPSSIGKSIYSYISDDPYVLKKTMKLLLRRCPVAHKGKGLVHLSATGKAIDSDGESVDGDYLSEGHSIDLDEPISSSTPKPKRKAVDKTKEALEIAKVEKKAHERKEKEFKDLEKRNQKLKRMKAKRESDEMKRNKQEETKENERIKKVEALEEEEKNMRQGYMKRYQHHRRPSVPLGARLRSVRLTPSPGKKRKDHLATKSAEPSVDYPENDRGSLGSGRERAQSESEGEQKGHHHKSKGPRKIGHEQSDNYDMKRSYRAVSPKGKKKFFERFSFRNAQTMYIMASVPFSPGRSREIVLCMIRNVPRQGVVMFKPALGYRNIEAKRNHVFRVSCELTSLDGKSHTRKPRLRHDSSSAKLAAPGKVDESLVGFFELVPKNEMRLTVMGEITTAEGFDSSPLSIYYLVDIPKGWRNDSILNHVEGITHTCYTNDNSVAHYSHEFSFHLVFSMDVLENSETYPTPTISLLVVSMDNPSPRIIYEGYGYVNIPMSPGTHFVKIKMWKPRPRTTVEKLQAAFLNITPSLQDIKFVHMPYAENEVGKKANLLGFQTVPTGAVKLRFHIIHQMPITFNKEQNSKLDLLEKMSSATILKSVQAVIEAFQRARQKAVTLKNQYQ